MQEEKLLELQNQMKQLTLFNLIGRCVVSCMLVLLTQFALSLVPASLSASSLLIQLPLSGSLSLSLWMFSWSWRLQGCFIFTLYSLTTAVLLLVVMGLGGWTRRVLGVHASAPAFVFFSILFVWCVYVVVIRKGPPFLSLFLLFSFAFYFIHSFPAKVFA